MPRRILLLCMLLLPATFAKAEDHNRTLMLPADVIVDRAVDGRGQAFANVAEELQRSDLNLTLEPVTQVSIEGTLEAILRTNPRFSGGVVELSDGRRLSVSRQAGILVIQSTGGAVGGIPSTVPSTSTGPAQVIAVTDNRGVSIPMTGAENQSVADCGANTSDPTTHCGLSTVRLIDDTEGLFCTAVAITDNHLLTAAHCLCDKQRDGVLETEIHAKFGAGPFFDSLRINPDIALFSGLEGTHCASGQTAAFSSDNGDLAVLTLVDPDPDDDKTPLQSVAAAIAIRGEQEGETLDMSEVNRLRALVGQVGPDIWVSGRAIGNPFAVWSFGEGPDGQAGTKRAMIYPLETLMPCNGQMIDGMCQGLQEALFRDREHGLCAGDSGAGVFKPADKTAENRLDAAVLEGYGAWALMGIVSGDISPADCFTPDGVLLSDHHPRNVTRIDTPAIAAWLDTVTGDQVRRSPVRMTFDVVFAGNP